MLARYKTEAGAAKYADLILARFPQCGARVVPNDFDYGVLITLPDGGTAMAGKRPRGYDTRPVCLIEYAQRAGER